MTNDSNRVGTYQAIYFIKEDLKAEKRALLEDMREIALNTWGGTDPVLDELMNKITKRVEEINSIMIKVETGVYAAPEDD